jgi:hypothetical protein
MVRHLINDVDETNYKYSQSRLETTLTVAAQLISQEITFDNNYIVDITEESITPDPVSDSVFINFLVLRAACIILGSEVKTESSNAISIKDGPSAIDLRGVSSTLITLYKDLCATYDDMVIRYGFDGNSGKVIIGPYSPGSDYVTRTHNDQDFRGGYFRY